MSTAAVETPCRPILYTGSNVRAILDDLKTQTRRVVKITDKFHVWNLEKAWKDGPGMLSSTEYLHVPFRHPDEDWSDQTSDRVYPPWEKGDRLWVRETWRPVDHDFAMEKCKECPSAWLVEYQADKAVRWGCPDYDARKTLAKKFGTANTTGGCGQNWKPSIFMPRWASRITLEITGVRVERLQDISEADAKAEGIRVPDAVLEAASVQNSCGAGEFDTIDWSAVDDYEWLWDSINGKKHPWKSNPWVWVIEFKKL